MSEDNLHKEKTEKMVNMRSLKSFALAEIPKGHPLREVLLAEKDEISVSLFLARLPIWMQLSRFKKGSY